MQRHAMVTISPTAGGSGACTSIVTSVGSSVTATCSVPSVMMLPPDRGLNSMKLTNRDHVYTSCVVEPSQPVAVSNRVCSPAPRLEMSPVELLVIGTETLSSSVRRKSHTSCALLTANLTRYDETAVGLSGTASQARPGTGVVDGVGDGVAEAGMLAATGGREGVGVWDTADRDGVAMLGADGDVVSLIDREPLVDGDSVCGSDGLAEDDRDTEPEPDTDPLSLADSEVDCVADADVDAEPEEEPVTVAVPDAD